MAAVASLYYPLSAASLPRGQATCFTRAASLSRFAAAWSSGHCCGCGVPCVPEYARLRSRWRGPIRAKVDEVDKDKGAGLRFRPPDRRKLRVRLRPRLLWWRLRRLSPREVAADAWDALRRAVRRVPPAAAAPVLLAVLLAAARLALPKNAAREVAYSDLVAGLREGAVSAAAFEDSRRIYFSKKTGDDDGSDASDAEESAATKWPYYARRVPHDEGFLLGLMREGGVDYRSSPRPAGKLLVDMLSTLLTLWGVDEAKEELVEIVSCLHGSLNYKKLGAKLPRGVLLVGPPGTGKTLLARAVAGEAGIPFFSVSASEFVEVFVGRGAARVRDLFKEAKEAAPSIIFIDELDAVGGSRGRSFNDERDQTLNQLLTEMDGFDSDMKVIVMAATNRPKALERCPLSTWSLIQKGLVGADLANIVNEAALLAARRGANTVAREDIMDAIEREKCGVNGRQQNDDSERQGLTKLFPWLPKPGSKQSGPDDFGGLMGYHTLS
ncbi:hypothetical protein QOZ80_4BG0345450 [Eleusine coracana subsp. coracana]|nr:hypothetical protein QOZ80_4BG0345450 [Eleusine coracana subsp. coracana]